MSTLSLADAYEAIHSSGVRIPLEGRGLLRLTGPQRVWFLQNTVTADIEAVEEGAWTWSCLLDAKGKVQAHMRVGVLADEVFLDVDPPAAAALAETFVRLRFRTKVEISVVARVPSAVLGPAAVQLVPRDRVVTAGGSASFGDELRTSGGVVPLAIVHAGGPEPDVPLAPAELYDILRVEAGLGVFGVDFGPDTLPQEAGLSGELSVTKGCYVGQEVVARIHFRGHVNRALRRLDLRGPLPEPGADLRLEGEKVGRVTSAVVSPRSGPIGLGMVRVTVENGQEVDVTDGGSAIVGPIPEGTKTQRTPPSLG